MRDTNVIALSVALRLSVFSPRLYSALLAAICSISSANLAWSQAHDAARPAGGSGPSRGNFGAQAQRGGGATKANPKGGPLVIPKGGAPELIIKSDELPAGYEPPAEKDPRLEIDKPIALPDEISKLKMDLGKYQTALRKADSSDAGKSLIRNGIRYRLALMCQRDNLKNLSKLRIELAREMNGAGSTAGELKTDAYKEFRRFVMQELVNQATPLLDNNLYVRIQIAILIGELDLTEEDQKRKLVQEAFSPGHDLLLKAVTNAEQPASLKIVAVNGLMRILRLGTPNVNERAKIAEALIAQLNDKQAHPWYQMRLAGALGLVALDQLKQHTVVDALVKVAKDPTRSWSTRAEAAKSLGRVPIPPNIGPNIVVRAVADLAMEMAKAVQQNPANPHWKSDLWKIYLAFQPIDGNEKDATKTVKAGLLNNPVAAALAKPAYDKVVPIARAVINNQRLTAEQLQQLGEWIKTNTPANQQNGDSGMARRPRLQLVSAVR